MTTALESLPPELLDIIVGVVRNDGEKEDASKKSALCHLTLTSSALRNAARPHLYHDVQFAGSSMRLLLRSIAEDATLGTLTRALSVRSVARMCTEHVRRPTDTEITTFTVLLCALPACEMRDSLQVALQHGCYTAEALLLLLHSPNIRTLTFAITGAYGPYRPACEVCPDFLEHLAAFLNLPKCTTLAAHRNRFDLLATVNVYGCDRRSLQAKATEPSHSTLYPLFKLPALRSLTFGASDYIGCSESLLFPSLASNISELMLFGDYSSETLVDLLSACRALTKLQVHWRDHHEHGRGSGLDNSAFFTALRRHESTLRTLSIIRAPREFEEAGPHQVTIIEFHRYRCLRILGIDPTLLFGGRLPGGADLSNALPPSLESLHIFSAGLIEILGDMLSALSSCRAPNLSFICVTSHGPQRLVSKHPECRTKSLRIPGRSWRLEIDDDEEGFMFACWGSRLWKTVKTITKILKKRGHQHILAMQLAGKN